MATVTTMLGDVWHINNGTACPDGSERVFGLTEDMELTLKSSSANASSAEILRALADGPLEHAGHCVLIPADEHPGFSRAVSMIEPCLSLEDEYFYGAVLFHSERPEYIIREIVGEPGAYYGPYQLLKYDQEAKKCAPVGTENNLQDAMALLDQVIVGNVQPLPFIDEVSSGIMKMNNGYSAEIIAASSRHDGCYSEEFVVAIISNQGEAVRIFETESASYIMSIRDDANEFKAMLNKFPETKEDGVLRLFSNVETTYPVSLAAMRECLDVQDGPKVVKFLTADDQYQILLSGEMREQVYRDQSGRFISDGAPQYYHQLSWVKGKISFAREAVFTMHIKRTDGVMYEKFGNKVLDASSLYDLITSKDKQVLLLNKVDEAYRQRSESLEFSETPRLSMGDKIGGVIALDDQSIVANIERRKYVDVDRVIRKLEKNHAPADYSFPDDIPF